MGSMGSHIFTVRKGNVFTSVCQEFCPRGGRVGGVWQWACVVGVCIGAVGVGGRGACVAGEACVMGRGVAVEIATAAGGTHLTGVHSCMQKCSHWFETGTGTRTHWSFCWMEIKFSEFRGQFKDPVPHTCLAGALKQLESHFKNNEQNA